MQVAANTEQYVLSATLIGATEEKSRLGSWFLQPIYLPEYEAAHRLVHSRLEPAGFDVAYALGTAMTGKELLEFVLANFQIKD